MTDYVYYINPAAAASGDGTTDALSGGSHAYQTLNAAITARAGSHGSGNTITYRCSGNGSSFVDSTAIDISGHTEDSVIIEGYNGNYSGYNDDGASAYDNTSYYALETGTTHTVRFSDPNVTLRNLQIKQDNGANGIAAIQIDEPSTGADNFLVDSCRIRMNDAGTDNHYGIYLTNSSAGIVQNCTIEGDKSGYAECGVATSNFQTIELYNNTIYGCSRGIGPGHGAGVTAKNNAFAACDDDWYSGGTPSYTASNNADSNDGDTPGTSNQTLSTTLTDEFTNPSSGIFTIADAGSVLDTTGTSGGNIPTDDLGGNSRTANDIGAWFFSGGGGATVTPSQGSVAVTGNAPTVNRTDNKTVSPSQGSLTVTGSAPTISVGANKTVEPSQGSLTITGYVPTVSVSANKTVSVGQGSLTITGYAPTVSTGDSQTVQPSQGSIVVTGNAPTISVTQNQIISVGQGSLVIAGVAPTISVTSGTTVEPAQGSLTITGSAPTLVQTQNKAISVGQGSVTVTGYAPTVVRSGDKTIAVGQGSITVTGYAPTITQTYAVFVRSQQGSIQVTGFAPTILTPVTVRPAQGTVQVTGVRPTLSIVPSVSLVDVPNERTMLIQSENRTSLINDEYRHSSIEEENRVEMVA